MHNPKTLKFYVIHHSFQHSGRAQHSSKDEKFNIQQQMGILMSHLQCYMLI